MNAIIVPDGKTLTFANHAKDDEELSDTTFDESYVTVICQPGGKIVVEHGAIIDRVIMLGGDLEIEEAGKIETLLVRNGFVDCRGVLHRCIASQTAFQNHPMITGDAANNTRRELFFRDGAYVTGLCNYDARCGILGHARIAYYEQSGDDPVMHLTSDDTSILDGLIGGGSMVLHCGRAEPAHLTMCTHIVKTDNPLRGVKGELYEQDYR